jgi:hypothetical protein
MYHPIIMVYQLISTLNQVTIKFMSQFSDYDHNSILQNLTHAGD